MNYLFNTKYRTNTMNFFQRSRRLLKGVSAVVITTLLSQQLYPTLHAAQNGQLTPKPADPKAVMMKMHRSLQGLTVRLHQLESGEKVDRGHVLDRIETLRSEIEADDAVMLERFAEEERELRAKKLPEVIIERHKNMVRHYKAERAKLLRASRERLDKERGSLWEKAQAYWPWKGDEAEEVQSPYGNVDVNKFERSQQKFDPEKLPTSIMKPNPENTPKLDKADFTLSGLLNTPTPAYAALGDFKYDALVGASDPAYLGESDEVVLTDDIKAKAAELDYDAVKIYHWVRNNVEWIPAWGSAQNAQLTLEAMRGNAMDIAALTIALLRASKIPARFVHGTIRVPAEQFNNWVGGFEDVMAAGTYAGSAGIPLQYIQSGGAITHVHMEHIWVEAATDFYPSRGAKNYNADSWVQFDPSYKQYEFHEGIDAVSVAGIDVEALQEQLLSSAVIDEANGSVSSIDESVLQDVLTQAQAKLETYVDTNMTDPTVLDVIGGKKTIIREYPTLPSSLPNEILVTGARYAALPASLQQKVTISMESTDIYSMLDGDRTVTFPYAKVNNEKVTLSFRPATDADEAALEAYLPDGNITDISQLPSSLPANLIEVIPEVKVNGEVVLSGDTMNLGAELDIAMTPYMPGVGSLSKEAHTTVAGSYLSLNVVAQSVSPVKLEKLKERMEATKAALESGDQLQLSALTREEILGDMMYAGTLSYFAQLQGQTELSGLAAKARGRLTAANGIFGYEPKVDYLFGVARSISGGSVHLDIPINLVTRVLDNNEQKTVDFTVQIGITASTLEHLIPEQMFNIDPLNPTDAISAVKAIQIANAQSQKLYRIDQTNLETALADVQLNDAVKSEIRAAVSIGKYVITHTNPINMPGWNGSGYIILDPLTGEGAYKILGGENGGDYSLKNTKLFIGALVDGINYLINKLIIGPAFEETMEGLCHSSIMLKMNEKYSDFLYALGIASHGLSILEMMTTFSSVAIAGYGGVGGLLLMHGMLIIAQYYTKVYLALSSFYGVECN